MSTPTTKQGKVTFPYHSFWDTWVVLQRGHEVVSRWKGYRLHNPSLPAQTNLHHITSVRRLFHMALSYIISPFDVDEQLLLDAIEVHEDGEAICKIDVMYHDKIGTDDLRETAAFQNNLRHLHNTRRGAAYYQRMERAFLLQFVTNPEAHLSFPPRERSIIDMLLVSNRLEGYIFNALERFDYYLWARHAYEVCGDVVVLSHVIRNHIDHLSDYAVTIPGFDEMWSKGMKARALEFLEQYPGIPGPKEPGGIKAAYDYAIAQGYMTI